MKAKVESAVSKDGSVHDFDGSVMPKDGSVHDFDEPAKVKARPAMDFVDPERHSARWKSKKAGNCYPLIRCARS